MNPASVIFIMKEILKKSYNRTGLLLDFLKSGVDDLPVATGVDFSTEMCRLARAGFKVLSSVDCGQDVGFRCREV